MALLVLAWLLGQSLALGHRIGSGGQAGHPEEHLVGGHHEDGDADCRLIDQAGLGDTLPPPAADPAEPARAAAVGLAAVATRPWAAPDRAYEARGPPTG